MSLRVRVARAAALLMLATTGACSTAGGLGSVLGSVLGGLGTSQVSGYVQGVDTRYQQLYLQDANGQGITLQYDNNTQVIYNNQRYDVRSLERGDQVTARVQTTGNGAYYTDLVQVDRSVSGPVSSSSSADVQALQGTVRQVDQNNGLFLVDLQSGGRVTVQLPAQISSSDFSRFRALRSGDYVRFYGVFLSSSRVELRQFY